MLGRLAADRALPRHPDRPRLRWSAATWRASTAASRVFLTRAVAPVERLIYRVLGVDPGRGAGLEGLCPQRARAVRPVLARALSRAADADAPSVERAGLPLGHLGRELQHGLVVRDEHELAVLRRRDDDDLLQPDGGTGGAELRLGRGRHLRRGRAHPRDRRPQRAHARQLLAGPRSHAALCAAADQRRRRRSCSSPRARSRRSPHRRTRSRSGRSRRRRSSRCSAPTAAASSTSTRRTRSRIPPGSRTSSRCC